MIANRTPSGNEFVYSTVRSSHDANSPREQSKGWRAFVKSLDRPDVRTCKDGPALIAALFGTTRNERGNLRHDGNVTVCTAVVYDLDGKGDTYHADDIRKRMGALKYAAHTTYSSTPQAPRWRVIIPLRKPISPNRLKSAYALLDARTGFVRDTSCDNASRLFYLPTVHPDRVKHYRCISGDGEWFDASAAAPQCDFPLPSVRKGSRNRAGGDRTRSTYGFYPPLPVDPGIPIPLDGVINQWEQHRGVSLRLWSHLGLNDPVNDLLSGRTKSKPFTSPLPWRTGQHADDRPSAYLLCEDGRKVTLHDFGDSHGRTYSPEEFAIHKAAGRHVNLSGAKVLPALWTVRLLIECGLLQPGPTDSLAPCPDNATASQRKVYEGFKQAIACKWRVREWVGNAFPFTADFVATWSGVGSRQAEEGITWLHKVACIIHMEDMHGRTRLFAPGPWREYVAKHGHAASCCRRDWKPHVRRILARLEISTDPDQLTAERIKEIKDRLKRPLRPGTRRVGFAPIIFGLWLDGRSRRKSA